MSLSPRSPSAELASHESDARLLAMVDHDLRGPLLNLSMAVTLLTQGEPSAELNADLARIMAESLDRLGLLTRDLLEFARVRLGTHAALERGNVDIATVIATAARELAPSFPNHSIDVEQAPAPIHGAFDRARLVQLVRTLIGHALHCAPPRGTVRLATVAAGNQVTVEVRIEGNAAAMDRAKGAGLYLVQQLATLHGGTARVAPVEGSGIALTLLLPLAA